MHQDRHGDRPSLGQELFAARQVYVRSGPVSQYVTLSRSLQIAVATGLAAVALWLGVASYAAVVKHLETVEQGRELARLEGVAKALRTAVEEAQHKQRSNGGAKAAADLSTELAEVRTGRERALMLADAAAGEAEALRREVALANERIRELEHALAGSRLDQGALINLVSNGAGGLRVAGSALAPVACPTR